MELIEKAEKFAVEKHNGQKYGNRPFIIHPRETMKILQIIVPLDSNLHIAAMLHDTLEDTDTTYQELVNEFNEDVADLVREVTKVGYNIFPHLHTTRGVLLKFADRLANLSNMEEWSLDRQNQYIEKSRFWKERNYGGRKKAK